MPDELEVLRRENETLRLLAIGDAAERDMCGNCGNWRELHYHPMTKAWVGDRIDCVEYIGVQVSLERRRTKADDLLRAVG